MTMVTRRRFVFTQALLFLLGHFLHAIISYHQDRGSFHWLVVGFHCDISWTSKKQSVLPFPRCHRHGHGAGSIRALVQEDI
ncbi:hypothetical protein V8F06_006758 [Rhypophila decipiens]